MKLKKWVQGVLEIIFLIALLLSMIIAGSEGNVECLLLLVICLAVASSTGLVLAKFGRWE